MSKHATCTIYYVYAHNETLTLTEEPVLGLEESNTSHMFEIHFSFRM